MTTGTTERQGTEKLEKLRALRVVVERRCVCFDVFPERVGFNNTGSRTIGYELVLSGVHSQGTDPPHPGCPLCKDVYEDLKTIAAWILPREGRPSFYEIEPYRPVIRASRRRNLREEVTLSIRVLHREHYENPIDDCETRCVAEMQDRLRQIGACEGQWQAQTTRGIGAD